MLVSERRKACIDNQEDNPGNADLIEQIDTGQTVAQAFFDRSEDKGIEK